MKKSPIDSSKIIGKKFNRWTVISRSDKKSRAGSTWNCVCECGVEGVVPLNHLRKNHSKSCGCLQREVASTHNKSKTSIYLVWRNIKCRCLVPTNPDYPDYGGRGIKIDPNWAESFETFYAAVGDPPTAKHKIDRIDNNGDYAPGNVQWSTQRQQLNNRRKTRYYEHNGVKKPMSEWAEEYGIECNSLAYRLLVKKMSFNDAVSTPVRPYRKRSK